MSSMNDCDVFPALSDTYHKIRFPDLSNVKNLFTYIDLLFIPCYNKDSFKVYYTRISSTEVVRRKFKRHLQESSKTFAPNSNSDDWDAIIKRLSLSSTYKRSNEDVRLSYRFGNTFLVKSRFTFGQRTVDKDTVHIIQTHAASMICFRLRSMNYVQHIDRSLIPNDRPFYDKIKLDSNMNYVIKSNTCYILMAFQKTLFSLNVVPKWLVSDLDFELTIPEITPDTYTLAPPTPLYEPDHESLVIPEENQYRRLFLNDSWLDANPDDESKTLDTESSSDTDSSSDT